MYVGSSLKNSTCKTDNEIIDEQYKNRQRKNYRVVIYLHNEGGV